MNHDFVVHERLQRLHVYLPHQAPLRDFIHQNPLSAFQDSSFHEGLKQASRWLGYATYPGLSYYRSWYAQSGLLEHQVLAFLEKRFGDHAVAWLNKLLHQSYQESWHPETGRLYGCWKRCAGISMEKKVSPKLFRWVGAYLDQGVSTGALPEVPTGFLSFLRNLQKDSWTPLFRSEKVRNWLLDPNLKLETLLQAVVGNPTWFDTYLWDQAWNHPGWSGMVAYLERHPHALFQPRPITLEEFVLVALLLEADEVEKTGKPLSAYIKEEDKVLAVPDFPEELFTVYSVWQDLKEWFTYEKVLFQLKPMAESPITPRFQAVFCIDDREESFRRHVEGLAPTVQTFGTPGFFQMDCTFQPAGAIEAIKVCPAPMTPSHVVAEDGEQSKYALSRRLEKTPQGIGGGWLFSHLAGFWSAIQLGQSIFFPRPTPLMVSAFRHMDSKRQLRYTAEQVKNGFTLPEQVLRVRQFLEGMGLRGPFAPLVYVIGHGASSSNNTHYAGYDCGACSGRSGSVNARLISAMANDAEVRAELLSQGLEIPSTTVFMGAVHDTTTDEMEYFLDTSLSPAHEIQWKKDQEIFRKALERNAVERSKKFPFFPEGLDDKAIHARVKRRAHSFFEPRPEWNHATNALCLIGRRSLSRHVHLDRRAFLQSYDPLSDSEGKNLLGLLKAVTPVTGGINLEYYFSAVSPQRLGAGSKLPHNVVGLFGVANGIDGDLRPGLPEQMIQLHDPVRLLVVIEQRTDIVAAVLNGHPELCRWYENQWLHLVAISPEDETLSIWKQGQFIPFESNFFQAKDASFTWSHHLSEAL